MQTQESIKVTGKLSIVVRDESGAVKDQRDVNNLVVTTGKTFIASSLLKTTTNSPAAMSHMAVGTGQTAAAAGDTALGAEIAASRTALGTATSSGAVVTYAATFAAGVGTGAVTEAGIFNASSAGTMMCRTVFSVVNKGANDSMTITWTVTIS
jgi:hypothetical protein